MKTMTKYIFLALFLTSSSFAMQNMNSLQDFSLPPSANTTGEIPNALLDTNCEKVLAEMADAHSIPTASAQRIERGEPNRQAPVLQQPTQPLEEHGTPGSTTIRR